MIKLLPHTERVVQKLMDEFKDEQAFKVIMKERPDNFIGAAVYIRNLQIDRDIRLKNERNL